MNETIKVLGHGYLRLVESWGHGDAGIDRIVTEEDVGKNYRDLMQNVDMECGKIEAARQSTQASFRGWGDIQCPKCVGQKTVEDYSEIPEGLTIQCDECGGKGYLPGDQRLLASLFNSKPQHATPFEFAGCIIEVQAPIFVYREWHRHRTQSYNEMSARYAPLPDINYLPDWEAVKRRGEAAEKTRNKQQKGTHAWNEQGAYVWWNSLPALYDLLEDKYQEALRAGVPKELARITIPVGRYSRMRASANLRNWLAFVTLRSDPNAQEEIRLYSQALEKIIAKVFPRTYDLFLKRRSA